ncbi:MAG: orotidine-5'-phosphate decarboxylase [Deltaproteobacteria bacterium]|nr:orotidine-5'-phosphate decarboxylase [Deltaproteobacteria bacterium]
MNAKERLIFPLDVPDSKEAEKYIKLLGNSVGFFKVGLELFVAEGPGILKMISELSDAKIFLDLKFHDIPATVQKAQESANRLGAAFITVHCDEGLAVLSAAARGAARNTQVLAVTVLTSLGPEDLLAAGFSSEYADDLTKLVLKRAALAQKAGCAGVVCSGLEAAAVKEAFPDLVVVTPGIRPAWSVVSGDDQKRIVTPYQAIINGADYLVVGRPIRMAKDPKEAAEKTVEEIEKGLEKRS